MKSKARKKVRLTPTRQGARKRPPAAGQGLGVVEFTPENAIQRAVWARATSALRQIIASADQYSLQRAVEAPTDAGALARAVSDSAAIGDAVGALDPTAALIARGAEQKMALLKQAGGALSVSDVARLLGISRQGVDKRRRESKLLAVPRGADFAYPSCQFDETEVVPGLVPILKILGKHAWTTLAFLITPEDQLGGRSPLQVLRGKEAILKELVVRLARASAGDGFG